MKIVVTNDGCEQVDLRLDAITLEGTVYDVWGESLAPQAVIRVDPSIAGFAVAGARLDASGPVVASLVVADESRVAVMPGIPELDNLWLVPGSGGSSVLETSLWLLNSSEETISVTVSALTDTGPVREIVNIEAGRPYEIEVEPTGAAGLLVESTAPFSVAWSVAGPSGLALAAASPISGDGTPAAPGWGMVE